VKLDPMAALRFQRSAVAMDIGARTIRVVELRLADKAAVIERAVLIDRDELEIEAGDWKGLARLLRLRMAEARIPTKGVALGIGGQDSMMRYTRIPPVPAWRLQVIMSYEVGEISEKIGEPLASDYRVLELPREADEDQTVLIGLAKEKPLQELLDALEEVGISVQRVVPGALAIHAAHDAFGRKMDPDAPEDDLLLLADLGAENLAMALVLNGKLAFARSTSLGGKFFTEAIQSALGMSFEEAEELKIQRGGLDERERGVFHDTVTPLRTAAGQLLGMLQSSLRFSSSQIGVSLPPLQRVVLLGGGMRLRGLPAFIAQGLGKPAELFQPSGLKTGPGLSETLSRSFGTELSDHGAVIGLGMSGLREKAGGDTSKSHFNVMPSAYTKRRVFKERTVFLHAAGILLVLLLAGRLAHGIVRNSRASSVHADLQGRHATLTKQKTEQDETTRKAEAYRARLNRLLRESEQTAFQAYVLDLLSRTLRPEIQLERIYLDAEPLEDGTNLDYNLRISGRVNNEKRQGLDWVLELQAALEADERIASVTEESTKPEGVWYRFEISLRPNYVTY